MDCVDKNERCAQWAADGDCDRNLKFVLEKCPLSCGLCELQHAKQQRKQERSTGGGGSGTESRSSYARRLEEEAEAAAAAMLGVGAAAGAAYPPTVGGMAAATGPVSGPPSPPPMASFRLEVEELHGCETATDVPIQFVLPYGFTLGVDGRACFDIFRAPLGVTSDTGQLYHSRKDGKREVGCATLLRTGRDSTGLCWNACFHYKQ